MTKTTSSAIRLGLIGDNIAKSRAPLLHRTAGRLTGLDVTYDRLTPADLGLTFRETFAQAQDAGFRGINVTYPYKELAAGMASLPDPRVAAIGAVNTVIFAPDGPLGFNTDYTGFKRAYRSVMGDAEPGVVCLIGPGGVGKAVAFGLLDLGAEVIRCVDLDPSKAEGLAQALRDASCTMRVEIASDAAQAARGADSIVNCTPLGMIGIGGTPLPRTAMSGARWAFDAVYTPVETGFLTDAVEAGLRIISGYELFFAQGIDAWEIFTGKTLDHAELRRVISADPS
jgi:shikimate dehydrogenase